MVTTPIWSTDHYFCVIRELYKVDLEFGLDKHFWAFFSYNLGLVCYVQNRMEEYGRKPQNLFSGICIHNAIGNCLEIFN